MKGLKGEGSVTDRWTGLQRDHIHIFLRTQVAHPLTLKLALDFYHHMGQPLYHVKLTMYMYLYLTSKGLLEGTFLFSKYRLSTVSKYRQWDFLLTSGWRPSGANHNMHSGRGPLRHMYVFWPKALHTNTIRAPLYSETGFLLLSPIETKILGPGHGTDINRIEALGSSSVSMNEYKFNLEQNHEFVLRHTYCKIATFLASFW